METESCMTTLLFAQRKQSEQPGSGAIHYTFQSNPQRHTSSIYDQPLWVSTSSNTNLGQKVKIETTRKINHSNYHTVRDLLKFLLFFENPMHAYNVVWSLYSIVQFTCSRWGSLFPCNSCPLFEFIIMNNIMSPFSGHHVSIGMGPSTGNG